MKIDKFYGIRNVGPQAGYRAGDLVTGSNVDVGQAGDLTMRRGHTQLSATAHYNVHETASFTLATVAGTLTNVTTSTALHTGLGNTPRVWCHMLPDGRVAYTNGAGGRGIVAASGLTRQAWGVPIPASLGTATDTAGSLPPGRYRYQLTHRRTADGLEGGPIYSGVVVVALGGIAFTSLPTLTGHTLNVYLSAANGTVAYYAGNTALATFTFTSGASRILPCRTEFCSPPPDGSILPRQWGARLLVAVGNVLYGSRPGQPELFALRTDFRQLPASITAVEPVDGGVWVGTTQELAFLEGKTLETLQYRARLTASPVVLGSGVKVPGKHLMRGEGAAGADGMLCIAGRTIAAGYADGSAVKLTDGRYTTASLSEVAATFRMSGPNGDIPQYLAVPQ